MKHSRLDFVALIGITLGLIGVVSPIVWDYFKTRASVELQYISFVTLVEKSDELDKLSITYDGESLQQISKADFILVNTGRTPIRESDFVSGPEIAIAQGTKILDAKIDARQPTNLDASLIVDKVSNTITVNFPLLNPNDYIRFSVLTDSRNLDFNARARIVGIPELLVVDKIAQTNKVTRSVPWTVYPVGFFSAFLLWLSLGGIPRAAQELKIKKTIAGGRFAFPEIATPENYLDFVAKQLWFTTTMERRPLIRLIESFPAGEPLPSKQQKEIQQRVEDLAYSAFSNIPTLFVVLTIGIGGVAYIIAQIW